MSITYVQVKTFKKSSNYLWKHFVNGILIAFFQHEHFMSFIFLLSVWSYGERRSASFHAHKDTACYCDSQYTTYYYAERYIHVSLVIVDVSDEITGIPTENLNNKYINNEVSYVLFL